MILGMTKKSSLTAFACFLMACGSGAPDDCTDIEINGAYLVEYDTKTSGCSDIDPALVTLSAGAAAFDSAGCTVLEENSSDNECKQSGTMRCYDNGTEILMTMVLEVKSDDGGLLEGMFSVTVYGDTCTYDISYTRQ